MDIHRVAAEAVVLHEGSFSKLGRISMLEALEEFDPPFLDEPTGRRQAAEQVLVEAIVAEAAVQAFDEAIIRYVSCGAFRPGALAGELPYGEPIWTRGTGSTEVRAGRRMTVG